MGLLGEQRTDPLGAKRHNALCSWIAGCNPVAITEFVSKHVEAFSEFT